MKIEILSELDEFSIGIIAKYVIKAEHLRRYGN
jgi:hypothetical protein